MLRHKKIYFAAALLAVILYVVVNHFFMGDTPAGTPEQMAMGVKVSEVKQQAMPVNAYAFASLYSQYDAKISAEVAGTVSKILYTEGHWVAKGDELLVLEDTAELAQVAKAQAQAKLAKVDFQRSQQTYKSGATTKQAFDKAQASLQAAEAELAIAQANLDKKHIRAPFAGRLGAKILSPGDFVAVGEIITSIVNAKTLKVRYALPENYSTQLKVGQRVELRNPIVLTESIDGVVDFVAPSISATTRTVLLEAKVDNYDETLKPGMSVDVVHQLAKNDQALTIPEQAIVTSIEGANIFKIIADKDESKKLRVKKLLVQLGARANGIVEIKNQIKVGDRVVTEGQQKIRDGQFVSIVQ